MKVILSGSEKYIYRWFKNIETICFDSKYDVEIDTKIALENKIDLFGLFDSKIMLMKCEMLASSEPINWLIDDFIIEIRDRNKLIQFQKKCLLAQKWLYVKMINLILMELDTYEQKLIVTHYPSNLQIEHTDICNASCIMCTHYFSKNYNCKFVDNSLIDKLTHLLPHIEKITLHGIGEPFLHPNIAEFISIYNKYDVKLTCNTNASIMNDELAALIHKSFYSISISCDSCSKEIFEKIRIGLNYERFLNNVSMLRKKGNDLNIRMSVVAMRQNLHELPGIVELAYELGIDCVVISDLTTQTFLNNEYDSIKYYPATFEYYINKACEMAAKKNIQISVPEYILGYPKEKSFSEEKLILENMKLFKDNSFSEELYKTFEKKGFYTPYLKATSENFLINSGYKCKGICDFVVERPYLSLRGDLYLCCTNWLHSTGNIFEMNSFDEVYNGEIFQGIRKMFYEGNLPRFCVGCIFLRNNMMIQRIELPAIDERFYHHNYDSIISEMLKEK